MKQYIGTKVINAKPMTRLEYNEFRGWKLPSDEEGSDEGFLVEYVDGGKGNTSAYAGYISWSPKEVFERAYKCSGNLTFGDAITYLKAGDKVARSGWNGKGMWLSYVNEKNYDVGCGAMGVINGDITCVPEKLPWIGMKTADNKFVPWLASQTDILAEDWVVV
jgi:hypothetical protein